MVSSPEAESESQTRPTPDGGQVSRPDDAPDLEDIGLRDEVDETRLMAALKLDSEEIDWRKQFVGFDNADVERLTALTPVFEEIADDVATHFYDHLGQYDQTQAVLDRSERSVDQLEWTQQRYILSLGEHAYEPGGDPGYGQEYFRQRAVIGKLHERLDMPPKHYIGMYGHYHSMVVDELFDRLEADLPDGEATAAVAETRDRLQSFLKITNLDLQVAMDAYLQSGEQIWIDALEEMLQPVIVLGRDGEILLFNDAMQELTGVTAAEAREMELWEIYRTDETHDTKRTMLDVVLESEEPVREKEIELLTHDDEQRDVVLSSVPLYDDHGVLVGGTTIIQDITDLREQEAELARRQETAAEIEAAIAELRDATEAVANGSDEIADLADEQRDDVQQIADEVSDMSASIEEVAASADQVRSTSRNAVSLASEGQEAAGEARDLMEELDADREEMLDDVEDLQAAVDEIGEIVDIIDDIAEQTNILALNASIEAARAGEAGDGFAVVADEVKSLAEESQQRASEIEDIVADVRGNTKEAVDSLDETNDILQSGAEKVQQSGETFQSIAEVVENVSDGVTEVADATDDQAASTEAIAGMVDETAEDFERVAEQAEAIAAANEQQTNKIREISREVDEMNALDVQSEL
jgi:methyl-accepting chemotaxis protein